MLKIRYYISQNVDLLIHIEDAGLISRVYRHLLGTEQLEAVTSSSFIPSPEGQV